MTVGMRRLALRAKVGFIMRGVLSGRLALAVGRADEVIVEIGTAGVRLQQARQQPALRAERAERRLVQWLVLAQIDAHDVVGPALRLGRLEDHRRRDERGPARRLLATDRDRYSWD